MCRGSGVGAAKCKGVAVVVATLRLTPSESRCCRSWRSPLCAAWHGNHGLDQHLLFASESGVHHIRWERCLLTKWMDENGVQRKRYEQVLELGSWLERGTWQSIQVSTEYFVGAAGEHGAGYLVGLGLLRCRRLRRKDHSSRLLLV